MKSTHCHIYDVVFNQSRNWVTVKLSNKIFRLGIRQKVVLILVTVLLSALTMSSWLALQQEKKDTVAQIHQRGSDINRFLAKSLAYSVVGYDYHTIQLLLDEITRSDIVAYAKVINAQGRIMAQSGMLKKTTSITSFSQTITLGDEIVGKLITGISTEQTFKRLEQRRHSQLLQESLIILLIALGEFIALSLIIIRPVRIITESLKSNIDAQGQITGTVPVISNDEFGTLAEQFNEMSKELNKANKRLVSKVDLADEKLKVSNRQLVEQSKELKKIGEEFKRLSITDSLTGLYNRRYFEVLVEAEVSMSLRYNSFNSLLIIDIDRFKPINDEHGHYIGDQVLKDIALRMKLIMRKTDTLCRLGGEEFVAFCKNAKIEDGLSIAEKLRLCIMERPFNVNRLSLNATISIGAATMPSTTEPIDTIEEFYRQADDALYYSKKNGRNRVTHYSDLIKENKARSHE